MQQLAVRHRSSHSAARLVPAALLASLLIVGSPTHAGEGPPSPGRLVDTDCFVLVFDDPVSDARSAATDRAGFFTEDLTAFATASFSSAEARGVQESLIVPGTGVIESFGAATASLSIQGLAEANALSELRTVLDLGTGGRLDVELLNLLVDDQYDGGFAFDRPGDAWAAITIIDGSGAVVWEQRLDLDDEGTQEELLIEDPFSIELGPGTFEVVIAAGATDATSGIEEIQGSFAAAVHDVRARAVPCPADLDGDGAIGTPDLLGLLAAFGDGPGSPGDLDLSGMVDAADLLVLLASWGDCGIG